LGVAAPVMSKHLRVLRRHGMVSEQSPEFDARVRIYSLRSAPMADLRSWLAAAEQGWAQQLAAFAEHVGGEP
jgi:DNA-binding transcriptional ArsR family regulator